MQPLYYVGKKRKVVGKLSGVFVYLHSLGEGTMFHPVSYVLKSPLSDLSKIHCVGGGVTYGPSGMRGVFVDESVCRGVEGG